MSKLLVLGDCHGELFWKDIIEKENPDKVIFLGDYVSSHKGISAETQLSNLKNILTLEEEAPDKVILLRGNHELTELGYYWAMCYPNNIGVRAELSQYPLKDRFLNLTQWIYIDEELNTIFSHAGISSVWMQNNNIDSIYDINKLEPSKVFAFTPDHWYDESGYSVTQPPVWIRPESLLECNIEGWTQVVGHTPVSEIHFETSVGGEKIWLCDNLGNKEYLVIDNNTFEPKIL